MLAIRPLALTLFAAALFAGLIHADGTHLGSNYCRSTVNSSGGAAVMSIFGPDHGGSGQVFLDDPVVLGASPVPSGTHGVFIFGTAPNQVPFGNGFLCVTGTVKRLPVAFAPNGVMDQNLTFSDHPDFTPGPWYFQAWFRDTGGAPHKFNLSDGSALLISP